MLDASDWSYAFGATVGGGAVAASTGAWATFAGLMIGVALFLVTVWFLQRGTR